MVISHDFGIDLKEYAVRGKENDFPILDTCPNFKCVAYGNIHLNGYYWRYGVADEETVKIMPSAPQEEMARMPPLSGLRTD
ncbi:hypothetical protein V7087_00290 [Neobacillus niacini]|uniref:hypothetical protein n=1 Tax=Neobacillus niacini TaxID=86668 RepID=UPI002FFFAE77